MGLANKPTPPPGSSAEGVGRGQCVRVLINSPDLDSTIYLVLSILFAPYCLQNDRITPLLRACESDWPSLLSRRKILYAARTGQMSGWSTSAIKVSFWPFFLFFCI